MLGKLELKVAIGCAHEREAQMCVEMPSPLALGDRSALEIDKSHTDLASLTKQVLHERPSKAAIASAELLSYENVLDISDDLAPVVADLEHGRTDDLCGGDLTDDAQSCSRRIHQSHSMEFSQRLKGTRPQKVLSVLVEECETLVELPVVPPDAEGVRKVGLVNMKTP
jgi:hypothetical protein